MSLPTITAEIAFATDPAASPTWVDVSAYCQAFSIRRGRSDELSQYQAGTATVTLDNRDRRFDPTYTDGAYYPNVRPMRRLRISATWSAVTYRLFSGYVEGWPQSYGVTDATTTVTASDAFAVLGLTRLTDSFAAQDEAARVAAVLDAAGWPSGERNLLGGVSPLQAVTLTSTAALDHLQTVAASTNARLFVAGDGDVTWISRHAINLGDYASSAATYGEAAGELPYSDITVGYGIEQVYNSVRVEREGGTAQTASDATSIARYYTRTLNQTGLVIASDHESEDAAVWLLAKYKEPAVRVTAMSLDPEGDDALWPGVLGYDLGKRLTVRRRPVGDPTEVIEQVSHLEAISHDWIAGAGTWRTSWGLSPAEGAQTYWILGTGALDSTTVLHY